MARPRQPTDLVILKGKKHLTKQEIADRKSKEVKAQSDNIQPPSYLDKSLQKEFNEIATELAKARIMTNLDVDALARFVISKKLYLKVTKKLMSKPAYLLDKDIVGIQDKFYKQCRSAAGDLGLTISSRCKLVLPKKEEQHEESKWDKYRNRSGIDGR